jgi:hypothetical protein
MLGAIISFIAWKRGGKKYLPLSILLLLTFLIEWYVPYLIERQVDFTYLYHLFTLIEYSFFCWFLLDAIPSSRVRKIAVFTIPFYLILSFSLSIFYYHFTGFPGLNIEMEAMLLSVLCTYILFSLDVREDASILRNQYFWICSGILIFFGTTFFFNGLLTYVLSVNPTKAVMLFGLINKPLNLTLYAFILIGILCSVTRKRLSTL